ncbi:unnamed protein product [Clavelina lepadiformis]|uniref:Elongator complex protein 5 n=1 Tax=Clavelina lepadiformis TaxID=159417 RepID=A0ABP0F429_CLALP
MLEKLLSGEETSRLVLICDDQFTNGSTLLRAFARSLIKRGCQLHLFCFEQHPTNFVNHLNLHNDSNVHVHDFYSDPIGWNDGDGCLLGSRLFDINSKVNQEQAGGSNTAVVIDSLSITLQTCESTSVCQQLHKLSHNQRVIQTVMLHHTHLHVDDVTKRLSHISDSVLKLNLTSSLPKITFSKKSVHDGTICVTVHRKLNGKVFLSEEKVEILSDSSVEACPWQQDPLSAQTGGISLNEEPDVTSEANLTFNLNLSVREKKERSKLVMPYIKASEEEKVEIHRSTGGGGKIFYEPDDVDDFDDEDPDEDLEF